MLQQQTAMLVLETIGWPGSHIAGGRERRSWMCRQLLLLINVLKALREVFSACSKASI
jgi:hypothetical protein